MINSLNLNVSYQIRYKSFLKLVTSYNKQKTSKLKLIFRSKGSMINRLKRMITYSQLSEITIH